MIPANTQIFGLSAVTSHTDEVNNNNSGAIPPVPTPPVLIVPITTTTSVTALGPPISDPAITSPPVIQPPLIYPPFVGYENYTIPVLQDLTTQNITDQTTTDIVATPPIITELPSTKSAGFPSWLIWLTVGVGIYMLTKKR
jgi:hypothetical protein